MAPKKNDLEEEDPEQDTAHSAPRSHVGEYRDDTCSICLEKYESDCNPAMLYLCGHAYHLQCAETWRQRNCACPMCWNTLIEVGLYCEPQPGEAEAIPTEELLKAAEKGHDAPRPLTEAETDEEDRGLFNDTAASSELVTETAAESTAPRRTTRYRRFCLFCC